jgi:hypothetical protein
VDQVFSAAGPAIAVRLSGSGQTIVPASWMSLSGRPQATPDRNTRGWVDADGTRHWLDVFADVSSPVVPEGRPVLLLGAAAVLLAVMILRHRRRRTSSGPGAAF